MRQWTKQIFNHTTISATNVKMYSFIFPIVYLILSLSAMPLISIQYEFHLCLVKMLFYFFKYCLIFLSLELCWLNTLHWVVWWMNGKHFVYIVISHLMFDALIMVGVNAIYFENISDSRNVCNMHPLGKCRFLYFYFSYLFPCRFQILISSSSFFSQCKDIVYFKFKLDFETGESKCIVHAHTVHIQGKWKVSFYPQYNSRLHFRFENGCRVSGHQ